MRVNEYAGWKATSAQQHAAKHSLAAHERQFDFMFKGADLNPCQNDWPPFQLIEGGANLGVAVNRSRDRNGSVWGLPHDHIKTDLVFRQQF